MKEQKICSFTQPGYRLQLLKITETTINGYYQIRENRKIKATFTTLDAAIKKFYALQGSKILQKDLFTDITDNENLQYENDNGIITISGYTNKRKWENKIYLKSWQEYVTWSHKNMNN